jgi:neopullulanase
LTVTTPDWVKDAVFYQIFPDRFAPSRASGILKPDNLEAWDAPPTRRGFKGGDLVGLAERFDYLLDLGVSAIYLNPIFQSTANHRYHTHDYHQVDPILGGNPALRALLDLAHAHGVRVVLDGVFNHASRGFFQFNHLLENGPDSPYLDWFHVEQWPLHPYDSQPPNYRCWWSDRELPEFNTETPAVREFLWGVAQRWIEFGIDGWRLDVPEEIDDEAFWREFRRRVKGANPEAYLVGEIWHEAQSWLQGDQFDAVMNYPFNRACLAFMGGAKLDTSCRPGGFRLRPVGASAFAGQIDRSLEWYPWEITLAQLNLLGSHDTPRFLTLVGGETDRLKLATLFQMTFPGAPCIYYGDEIGMRGGNEPACRGGFPWDESRWDLDLREYVKRCIRLRHDHPALRRGSYTRVYSHQRVYAFLRQWEDNVLLVALNAAEEARVVNLPAGALVQDGTAMEDVWSGERLEIAGGRLRDVRLERLSGRVFKLTQRPAPADPA